MLKADIERMTHYYYRKSKVSVRTIDDFIKADKEKNISKLFEIYEDGFVGKWYYIIRKKGSSFSLDYGLNSTKLNTFMKPYMEKYKGQQVNAEELKLYRKGLYPAIHKVDQDYFYKYCDTTKKVNNSDYRYIYTETSVGFVVLGDYNNKFMTNVFDNEEDAISSLLDLHIMSQNVSKEDLYKYVIDDREEKDFEMIF